MKVKLAFYKCYKGKLLDWIIALWSSISCGKFMPYSHVELLFDNGYCFSSSFRDKGVRFKKINFIEDRWDYIELNILDDKVKMKTKCNKYLGKRYDWTGIFFHQFIPLGIDDRDKYWCSEIVAYVSNISNYKVSPNKLYQQLKSKTE